MAETGELPLESHVVLLLQWLVGGTELFGGAMVQRNRVIWTCHGPRFYQAMCILITDDP